MVRNGNPNPDIACYRDVTCNVTSTSKHCKKLLFPDKQLFQDINKQNDMQKILSASQFIFFHKILFKLYVRKRNIWI